MRCMQVFLTICLAAVTTASDCLTEPCSPQDPSFIPWKNLFSSKELVLNSKLGYPSRHWTRPTDLNELRRASVRWGKRYDTEWRQAFKDLLHPRNIALSPNWTPLMINGSPAPNQVQDLESNVIDTMLEDLSPETLRPKLAPKGRLWGR